MAQLIDAGSSFAEYVDMLARRVKIEEQEPGWAIIINNQLYTWAVSEARARSLAIRLVDCINNAQQQ